MNEGRKTKVKARLANQQEMGDENEGEILMQPYWLAGWQPYSRQEELLWVGSVGESPSLWVMNSV